jgi:autotransporter-associated beta strand protein
VTSLISDGVIINGIIPWAVVNNELASYRDYVTSPAQYGIGSLGQSGYSAYDATQTSGDYSTKNFSLSGPLTLTGDLKVNALRAGGQNVAFTTGTETLNLTAGALIVQGTVNNTIGATPDSGRITAGGTASSGTSDLYVHVYNNAFKCNSRIIDNPNGARVRLVMAGYGNGGFSIYAPGNNYTGGTVVNGNNGLLTLAAASGVVIPNSNDPAAGLIINDFCTVTESGVAGQIGSGNIVTLNGYAKLTLVGGDTLAGLVFNNNSGSSAPTVTPTGILTLNGDISCTPSNVAATAIISGGTLNLNSRTCAVEVKPLPEGNYYLNGANWTALKGLTISSVVTSGGLTVKGGGVLELSGANTFSGQLTVESGVLNMGSINNVSANGALGNSASAVILGKNDGSTGTLEYTGSTATSSKPFTMATGGVGAFQVDTAANTLTLSGLIDGSGGLTKTGPGTLKLTYADTYSGNTTISAGTLKLDTAGSIASTPVINIAGGATFDVTTLTTALTLGSGQTLQSCASNTPAILLTAASKTVTLGASSPLAFTAFKPAELGGAVPLTISGAGDLILQSGTPVTVTVANDGIPLPIGTYKLIATNGAGGVVSMLPGGTLTVDGDGAGKASLVLTSGELYLNVATNKSKIGTIVSFF